MHRRTFLRMSTQVAGAVVLAGGLATTRSTGITPRVRRVAAEELGQAPPVATFRGSYDGWSSPDYLGPVALHAGLVVVRARHNGPRNFGASLLTSTPGSLPPQTGERYRDYAWSWLLINSAGRYTGAATAIVPGDGDYYLEIGAAGAYEFVLEQPVPGNVSAVAERVFGGEAQGMTPVFALEPGSYTVRVTSPADLGLDAWLYELDDLGGGAINGDYANRFASRTTGPFEETTSFTTRRGGLYLVAVNATALDPATPKTWTVSVE